MKSLHFSLAVLLATGTMLSAADTLADAFKNGKLQGELKAYYYDRDWSNGTTATGTAIKGDIINLGVKLDYETAPFYNFRVGFGFQSSNAPWVDDDGKIAYGTTPGPGAMDMWGSGAVLSQAYLAYDFTKLTSIKVGRQYIDMPLIGSAPSRLIVESFQGVSLVSKEFANTTIMAAYVDKFQGWTDGTGDIADFGSSMNGSKFDYAYAIAIINKSLTNTTLTAAYGAVDSTDMSGINDTSYKMIYVDALYQGKTSSLTYELAAQYGNVNYDSGLISDANFYGIKAGIGFSGLNLYAAYDKIADGNAWWGVAGSGTKPLIYTSTVVFAGGFDESTQYAFDINYLIKPIDLTLGARYVNVDYKGDSPIAGDKADITSVYAGVMFSGALKGLGATIAYEDENHDVNANDKKELWFRSSYRF